VADKKRSHPQAPLYYGGAAAVPNPTVSGVNSLAFSQLTGQIADAQVPESAVTQHEAALTIADPNQLSFWPLLDAAGALVNDGAGNLSWVALGGGSPHALDDHTDVNAPTPADGDVLTWDNTAGEWVPAAPPGSGGSIALDALSDVNAPAPSDGQLLIWDATPGEWVAGALPSHTHAQADVTNLVTDLAAKQADLTLTSVQVVTASLIAGATESGNVALGKLGMLWKVVADAPCWVRLYGNSTEETADSARLITEDPDEPVLADLIFTSGLLTINLAPLLGYADRQGSPDGNIRYRIKNTDGSAAVITVTFHRITLEP
jgi:hypothetical protein